MDSEVSSGAKYWVNSLTQLVQYFHYHFAFIVEMYLGRKMYFIIYQSLAKIVHITPHVGWDPYILSIYC